MQQTVLPLTGNHRFALCRQMNQCMQWINRSPLFEMHCRTWISLSQFQNRNNPQKITHKLFFFMEFPHWCQIQRVLQIVKPGISLPVLWALCWEWLQNQNKLIKTSRCRLAPQQQPQRCNQNRTRRGAACRCWIIRKKSAFPLITPIKGRKSLQTLIHFPN